MLSSGRCSAVFNKEEKRMFDPKARAWLTSLILSLGY
jgi:hypothetical protein